MNISSTSSTEKINETTSQSSLKTNEDKDEKTSFSEEYNQLLLQNGINLGINEQNQLLAIMSANQNDTKNNFLNYANSLSKVRSSFNYDSMTISKDDALFFNDLVEKTEYIIGEKGDKTSFQTTLLKVVNDSDTKSLKSAEVSKSLMNLIEEAYQTQKPTRIDFDNNVSVILKISKEGKVSAEFIPGDKAVEKYLKDNIGFLKTRLEDQNIDYGDIMYKPYKNNSKQNRKNGGNK